jgi:hypothetical protein
MDPNIKPWYEGQQGVNREQIGRQQAQTGLIELQRLKESQAAEQLMLERIQQDPALAQQLLGGGPVLGSLMQPQAPPGATPMPPQPGMPGQDPSRYAGVSPQGGGPLPSGVGMPTVTPPQSILGSLGPAGQPQMQAPSNPLLAMARENPRAALMMQQQMQGQQDRQWKMQEQQLGMSVKVMEWLGRGAQGVHSQADLDAFRQQAAQAHPQAAAQLPQFYSKEAMQPFIDKSTSVLETQTLKLNDLKSQREALAAQQKLMIDQQQHGEKMTLEREKIGQQQTQQQQTQQQQTRSAEFNLQGEYNKLALPYREVRDAMGRIEAAGTSPTAAGDAALITAYMKMLDPTTGVRDAEVRNAQSVGGLPQQAAGWLEWLRGGAPLKDDVRKDFMERAQKLYAQYQKDYEQVGTQYREQAERQGLDPRNVVQDYRSTTAGGGRPGAQAQPTGQGNMGNTFTDADIAATLANPANKGKTRQQVIDAAVAKGLTYKER